MIALGETLATAAEVPFYLPTIADPTVGLTGHVFHDAGGGLTDEVQVFVPGGAWVNATTNKVIERGFGWYVLQLTTAQCSVAGGVYLRANILGSVAQPAFVDETIGILGGDLPVGQDGLFPFYMPNLADPIFGAPVTGYVFSAGEVKLALPGAAFVNADVADIAEVGGSGNGHGAYTLLLDDTDTANRGKAFVYATATGAQRFTGWVMLLGTGPAPAIVVPPVVLIPVVLTSTTAAALDHVAIALSRLCEYSKSNGSLSDVFLDSTVG